jgi:hypothetical protein
MGKLIHYTNKKTQPWHPYPDKHDYVRHGDLDLEKLWFDTYREAMEWKYDK